MNPFGNAMLSATEGLAGFDAMFRRSVAKIIPRFQQLIDHPAEYLTAEDVRIGPCIRWVTGIVFGVVLGLILTCDIALFGFGAGKPVAQRSEEQQLLFWLIVASGPVLVSIALLFWLRGGELILRRDSVEFRYGRRVVVCSWSLFNAPGEPEWLDKFTLAMTANPDAIDETKEFKDGAEKSVGLQIRSLQFRFRSSESLPITHQTSFPEIALRDLYRARLNEIASLILTVSRELGNPPSTINVSKTGA